MAATHKSLTTWIEREARITRYMIEDGEADEAGIFARILFQTTAKRYPQLRETSAVEDRKRISRIRANNNRKAKDQAMRDCGLVKVRGALGGIYWE